MTKQIVFAFLAAATFGLTARAEVINVQFACPISCNLGVGQSEPQNTGGSTPYSGSGPASDAGTYWNQASTARGWTFNTLLTSTDTATTEASVNAAGNGDYQGINSPTEGPTYTAPSFDPTLLNVYNIGYTNDTAPNYNANDYFTISGLTSGSPYTLYVISEAGGSGLADTTFDITDGTVLSGSAIQVVNANSNPAGWVLGTNYAEYFIAPGADGKITVAYTQTSTEAAVVNGFQLMSGVPEPGTIGLGFSGLLILFGARRFRKA